MAARKAKDIANEKLNEECRKCKRQVNNGGSCIGKDRIANLCLGYLEHPASAWREENIKKANAGR